MSAQRYSLELFSGLGFTAQQLTALNDRFRRIQEALNMPVPGVTGTTGTNGQLTLVVQGNLAVGSNMAPPISFPVSTSVSAIAVLLGTAPAGAAVIIQLYVGGVAWQAPITIAGTSQTVPIPAGNTIGPNLPVRVDITQVGSTTPGTNLSVSLRT